LKKSKKVAQKLINTPEDIEVRRKLDEMIARWRESQAKKELHKKS